MARCEIPEGWSVQAYRFALDPTPAQEVALRSHAGARSFAFNTMLAAVKANLDQRSAEKTCGPDGDELTPCLGWSTRSLRNEWNRRKHAVAVREDSTPWWNENSKEAYASGCRSLANALENWSQSRQRRQRGPRMGFPRFRSKRRSVKTSPTTIPGAVGMAEATKRQPRTLRGPLLRKGKPPEMPSNTRTYISGNG